MYAQSQWLTDGNRSTAKDQTTKLKGWILRSMMNTPKPPRIGPDQ